MNDELNEKNKPDSNKQEENFSNDFEQQKKELNVENFTKQQEQYRNMLGNNDGNYGANNFGYNDLYVWRIGFGRRFGAMFIDSILWALFMLIVAMVTGVAKELAHLQFDDSAQAIIMMEQFMTYRFMPLLLATGIVYYSMEIIFAQTFGKMLLGIIIGSEDKKFASYKQLFIRFSIKHLDFYLGVLLLFTSLTAISRLNSIAQIIIFIGYFFVLGIKKQALHDILGKTAVYYKDELEQFDNVQK